MSVEHPTDARETPRPAKLVESRPIWTYHGLNQWHNDRRNDVSDRDPDCGYQETVRIDYPSAYDGAFGRYHPEGDCVLIVKRDLDDEGLVRPYVVTVLALGDRPAWEREYVRCQVVYGHGGGFDG